MVEGLYKKYHIIGGKIAFRDLKKDKTISVLGLEIPIYKYKEIPSNESPIWLKSVAIHKIIVPGAIGAPKDKINIMNNKIDISLILKVMP